MTILLARRLQLVNIEGCVEHLTEDQLPRLLHAAHPRVKKIFAAIPLGKEDGSGFIVPEYDRDVIRNRKAADMVESTVR